MGWYLVGYICQKALELILFGVAVEKDQLTPPNIPPEGTYHTL